MMYRRYRQTLLSVMLLAMGCSGGGLGGGCSSCSCLAPIPGGFPPNERQTEAASFKLSQSGFQFVQQQATVLVQQQLGSGGTGSGLNFDVPCTPKQVPLITGINANVTVCDVDGDSMCTAADAVGSAGRMDSPLNKCQFTSTLQNVQLTPMQNANGTVDVVAELDLKVATGAIPITVSLSSSFLSSCTMDCSAQYNTDNDSGSYPPYLPVKATVELTIDMMNGNILSYDIKDIAKLSDSIDPKALEIQSVSGGCLGFTCSILNNDTVKGLLFSQLQGTVQQQIQSILDKVRCAPCDASGSCPANAMCDSGTNLCFYDKATDRCPTNPLGIQGEANLGSLLSSFGAPPDASLDLYMVAGGAVPWGQDGSTRVQNGGLQVGMMGGTHPPQVAPCAANGVWTAPATPPAMDFDAEAMLPGPGTDLKDYQVGLSISSPFLNKAAFDAWRAGLVCLDISSESVSLLSSSLFAGTLLPNLGELTHGQNVPMLIALRPTLPPNIVVGRGTTMADANGNPPDPLLTFSMKKLNLDFYAFIEQRYARLFTAQVDLALPLSLDFDPMANTVTPLLGDLSKAFSNIQVLNNEMNAGKSSDIAAAIPALLMTAQSQLTGALAKPVALPALMGYNLSILGARGSIMNANGPGYEHLALFAKVSAAAAGERAATRTSAKIVRSFVPTAPLDLSDPAKQPRVTLEAQAQSARPLDFAGYEYAYQIDGGLWSEWAPGATLELSSPALFLQGPHDLAVRSREIGHPESVDEQPPHLTFVVDYAPPTVQLMFSAVSGQVETVAHDAVTADADLVYRYRVAGADWSEWGAAQTFETTQLGKVPSLEVEVRDQAGRVGSAVYGTPAAELASLSQPGKKAAPLAQTGCSQTGAGLFAVLGLLALVTRRRRLGA